MSTHQDIWDPYLQHTILLINPTSFKNWTPTSWLLNRNAGNNLLGTLFAPSVARPNVVEQMYVLELRRRSYIWITEVTHIRHRCYKCTIFVRTRKSNSKHTTAPVRCGAGVRGCNDANELSELVFIAMVNDPRFLDPLRLKIEAVCISEAVTVYIRHSITFHTTCIFISHAMWTQMSHNFLFSTLSK